MKAKMITILLAIFAFSFAQANEARFDKTKAFIKVQNGEQLPTSKFLIKSTHLFGSNYCGLYLIY